MYPSSERDQRTGDGSSVPDVPDSDIPATPGQDTGIGRTRDVGEPPNTDEIPPPGEVSEDTGDTGNTDDTDDGQESVPEPPD
jgi:hypothetical protein